MSKERESAKKERHTNFGDDFLDAEGFSKYMHFDGFGYVIKSPPIPKVAFGSTLERECLPRRGPQLNSFMRRIQGEVLPFPGPFEYHHSKGLTKKLASKRGHAAFANQTPRLPPPEKPWVPPLGTYDVEPPRVFKRQYKPFGSALPRDMYQFDNNPGPASYATHEPFPYQKRNMAFGKACFRFPAVYMFCNPRNKSMCHKCKKQPVGDYFCNFQKKLDMCRRCMKVELEKVKGCEIDPFLRQKVYNELKEFKRARYCGIFHDHSGTSAAVQTMSRKDLHKKVTVENYLYQFVK